MYRVNRNPVSVPAVQNIQTAVNRIFDEALEEFFPNAKPRASSTVPPVDIFETSNSIVFEVELPGVDKPDVSISFDNGMLSISGLRREAETKDRAYHRREREAGRFERSFQLPSSANPEKIEARLDKGVLSVVIPKREEAKARTIEVKVE